MNAFGADPGALFQPANQWGHQGIGLLQFSDLPSLALRFRGYLFITWRMQSHSKAQASHPHGAISQASRSSLSHVAPFKHTTSPEALRLQKTFLYSSTPSSTPIINKEKAQNTTVFVTSRLSGTKEGKYWNRSQVNICQHEGVIQPKGQGSTFVKSKPNPRNSNFNLWTTELILVHWLRMSRLFGNLFA